MSLPKTNVRLTTSLAAKISDTASSLTLNRSTDAEGTTFAGTYFLTLDEGTSKEEDMIVTLAGASGTIVTRGLSKVDAKTLVTANRYEHDRGAEVKMTDSFLPRIINLLNGDETFDSLLSYTTELTPTDNKHLATKKYADDLAIAGAPDASTTVKGIVEEATAAEAAAGTATGATGARLFLPAAIASNTSSAAQLIPVTDADGDIPVEFMELDAAWSFTSTVNVGTATNFQLGGVAYTGTMADLNEASTFFQNTNMTGAEAETLTSGISSPIVTLHAHKRTFGAANCTVSGSGTQVIAHGLGATPNWVKISAHCASGSHNISSFGEFDGTTTATSYVGVTTGNALTRGTSSNIINLEDDASGGAGQRATIAIDATNITLTWTNGDTASTTGATFHWECGV